MPIILMTKMRLLIGLKMRNFNINEFKKWIEEKNEDHFVEKVFPKISIKKIKNLIENEVSKKTILNFYKNGGEVINENNKVLTIKVEKDFLFLNKKYVKL